MKIHYNHITDNVGLSFFLYQDSELCELDFNKFFKVISFILTNFWFHSLSLWFSIMRKTKYSYLPSVVLLTLTF